MTVAGVGGFAVAAMLARAGHGVTGLERFAEPKPVGSGLMLQPAGQHALAVHRASRSTCRCLGG